MSHPCNRYDELMLQLAHSQLGLGGRIKALLHARNCPQCRRRLERYSALSGALATAMASPIGARPISGIGFKLLSPRGLFLIILAGSLLTGFVWTRSLASAAQPPPSRIATLTCGTHSAKHESKPAIQAAVAQP